MKIVFVDLEDWQINYFKDKIKDQDVEYYKESLKDVQSQSIYDAEVLSIFIFSPITKQTLEKFPKLKLIATRSTGFDFIDLDACKEKGIKVCNVPAYGENTVAEHTFGLILNLTRNIHKAYIRQVLGEFSYEGLMGFDLRGKTLGVVATGKIGCRTIKIAKGFEMNVVAYDAYPNESLQEQYGFKYVSFDELLKTSDIISLHAPLNKHTYHLINKDAIEKMKDGVIIVNTARGPLMDNTALINGLKSGKIGGAGLDVLEGELLIKEEAELSHSLNNLPKEHLELLLENHDLMHRENVLITPHIAYYSKEGTKIILDTTLENIYDYIESRDFKNQVNK